MKKLLIVSLLLLAFSLPSSAIAGGDSAFGMSWSSAIGMGETADYISGFQARGINVEYRKRATTNVYWGLNVGYNVLSDSGSETISNDNVQATGMWGKYINAVPIYFAGFYEFGPKKVRSGRFYVGMNAGTAWLEKMSTLGLYTIKDDNWHVALAPEIGYKMPWDSFVGHVSVRYNYMLEAGDTEKQSWMEFRIGFGL